MLGDRSCCRVRTSAQDWRVGVELLEHPDVAHIRLTRWRTTGENDDVSAGDEGVVNVVQLGRYSIITIR